MANPENLKPWKPGRSGRPVPGFPFDPRPPKSMIASFSRALAQDLRRSMNDAEFDKALADSIDEIYQASTVKIAA